MVKKKNLTLTATATASGAATQASSSALKKGASDASALVPPAPEVPTTGPAPGDWPASTTSKRDEKKARSLGIISADEGNAILPAAEANVMPLKRSFGGFADEDDLDLIFERSFLLWRLLSQFASLEADKARLQKEVEPTSSKLENAIKMAAEARQNADSLTEELDKIKSKLKDEEASKLAAEAEKNDKDGLLHQSVLALIKAADISADTLGKLPDDSPIDVLTLALESNKLIQALLEKNNIMSRVHSMIFPKADQNKTLGQLTYVFAVDTEGTIEVIPVSSFTQGPSDGSSEKDRLERMKSRIAQMEKGMRGIHAMAAIIKDKGELATDAERYALIELHKASESLNWHLYSKTRVPAAMEIERLEENSKPIIRVH
ncbi:hypothetical protein QYE76_032087 [Lolium multiflorum]|uniref:Uncharacterized protein n=1 Tax=Lolium multiflorum TaxID=4521 RepID=A0AAD8QW62_LOLMU|nr:hypothetical protein QYE76_032087 [Lolium multiflorum]